MRADTQDHDTEALTGLSITKGIIVFIVLHLRGLESTVIHFRNFTNGATEVKGHGRVWTQIESALTPEAMLLTTTLSTLVKRNQGTAYFTK